MQQPQDLRPARLRGGNTRRLIYEELRRQIVGLELGPGTPLSEADIAGTFGVSRTPVREALILLADEGMVDIYPQRGTFVGPIRYDDVVNAQFVREALECAAIQRGITSVTASDVAELRVLLARQRDADARDDVEAFFELDETFHQRLMASGGHAQAWPVVSQAKAQMDRARRLSLPFEHKMSALIDQHEAVVDAAEAGDAPRAVEELRGHLRVVLADLERLRREQPLLVAT